MKALQILELVAYLAKKIAFWKKAKKHSKEQDNNE